MNPKPFLDTRDGRLWQGDCANVLARNPPASAVQLIYLDPPYNTGMQHAARKTQGARTQGPIAYPDRWGGLPGFLSMLEPRLRLMWGCLAKSGSLWIHLDHRAVHDVKVLACGLFGQDTFRGEIIWIPGNGARGRHGPSMTHQTLLVFAPSRDFTYNSEDPCLREPYADTSQSMHFRHVDQDGRRYRERTIGKKTYRYYADRGRRLGSVWSDCPAMRANTPLTSEATGYPTQKPEKLLERIVKATSLPGQNVLDPMCGSGTTLVAARRLGRTWIGIDSSPLAIEIARSRLRSIPGLDPSAPRRLTR